MTNGEITAEPQPEQPDYNPRLIAAALACVWFAVVAVMVAMGLMLILQGTHSPSTIIAAPVMMLLFLVQVPAAIGVLVLSILGGMWRPWLDGVMSAALLLSMMAVDLFLWPLIETLPGIGFTACSQDGCTFGSSTTDLWIGVGVQTLLLAILLVVTAHWLWRLRPEAAEQKANRLVIAGIALVCIAILAAVDSNIDTGTTSIDQSSTFSYGSGSGPGSSSAPFPQIPAQNLKVSGHVSLSNDLGQKVRVVYCPEQDCAGRPARTFAVGATVIENKYATGATSDSFVVLDGPSGGPVCYLVDPTVDGLVMLSTADSGTCGLDVQTLTVPH